MPRSDTRAEWLVWGAVMFVLGAISGYGCTHVADAQDGPRVLTAGERHDAAACLVAEAAPGPDYLAILYVLASKSSSLGHAARRYCALFVAHHPSLRQS